MSQDVANKFEVKQTPYTQPSHTDLDCRAQRQGMTAYCVLID